MQTWRVDDWPVAERRDAWADAIGRTHLEWGLDGRDGLVVTGASVSRRELGDVALVDCVAGPGSGARTRRRIAATDGAYVGLLLVRSGHENLEFGSERMVVRAGEAVLWDSRLPTRFRVPDRLVKRTLLVPLGRLPELAERPFAGVRLARTAATALLLGHLGTVASVAGELPPATARAAGSAAVELLAAALTGGSGDGEDADASGRSVAGGSVVGRAAGATRWRDVQEYAEARLGDPALDPRALAAACGLSLRALYTVFEQHGETVAGFLRRRRLARAHADLVRLGRATTVAAVGRRWGFADADSFARAYRRQFGLPPSRTLASR